MVNYGGFSYITLDKSKLQMGSSYQEEFLSTYHGIGQKKQTRFFSSSANPQQVKD